MRLQRLTQYVAILLVAWAALAAWQYHEYGHERQLAQGSLRRQAETVMNALVGGIRSHRRLGRFFEEQIQSVLEELARSQNILAVAVFPEAGTTPLAAGKVQLLESAAPVPVGQSWSAAGFRFVQSFHVEPQLGSGPLEGGGRGRGRGARWLEEEAGPFSGGGWFTTALVLDRAETDDFCRRAFRLRTAMVLAGGVVLACAGLAWSATVRMVEARGRARLMEADRAHYRDLNQAAAGLAHETRNPLSLIRGWTQRLARSELASDDQRERAQAIVEECDRVTARINQFLAFAKPPQPVLRSVKPVQVMDELEILLEPDLEAKGLSLQRACQSESVAIRADREMFRQALFNLLANAIHFSPESGTIEIQSALGQHGTLRIQVADGGLGVAPEAAEQLFTPYFTTRSDGTGLGLAIVRRVAAAHGWQSGYSPGPDGGSIFWMDGIHVQ